MNVIRNTCLTLATMCCAATLSAASPAKLDSGTNVIPVSFAGINLAHKAGAKVVYGRIRMAAQSVCKDRFSLELGQRREQWRQCVNEAIARAVGDLGAPLVTAEYLARNPRVAKPVSVASDH